MDLRDLHHLPYPQPNAVKEIRFGNCKQYQRIPGKLHVEYFNYWFLEPLFGNNPLLSMAILIYATPAKKICVHISLCRNQRNLNLHMTKAACMILQANHHKKSTFPGALSAKSGNRVNTYPVDALTNEKLYRSAVLLIPRHSSVFKAVQDQFQTHSNLQHGKRI